MSPGCSGRSGGCHRGGSARPGRGRILLCPIRACASPFAAVTSLVVIVIRRRGRQRLAAARQPLAKAIALVAPFVLILLFFVLLFLVSFLAVSVLALPSPSRAPPATAVSSGPLVVIVVFALFPRLALLPRLARPRSMSLLRRRRGSPAALPRGRGGARAERRRKQLPRDGVIVAVAVQPAMAREDERRSAWPSNVMVKDGNFGE